MNQIRLLLLSENIKETMNQIEHILSKDNIEEEQKKLWEQIKLILSKYNISNEQKASMIYILLRDSTDKQKHMRPIVEIFSRGSK